MRPVVIKIEICIYVHNKRRKHASVLEENTSPCTVHVDSTSGIHRNASYFVGTHRHALTISHSNRSFRKKMK